ncbi:MAG TPA: glycosyltransferase, partial [Acidimicrobiales bacterium]
MNAKQDDENPLVAPTDVELHVLSETTSSATDVIAALNGDVTSSNATWLFIVDESIPELDRVEAALTLRDAALESDDVVFADESGPDDRAPMLKSTAVGVHTLLSYNCVGRPALWRISSLRSLGAFDVNAGWAFEHDAYLRLVERGAQFHHVAKVLVAGRPTIAFDASHISEDSQKVVRTALSRRGLGGTVTPGQFGSSVDWRLKPPSPAPSIDIIIPTRDRIDLVRRCIDAIEQKTTYENYDIILLDNDSIEQTSLDYFATTKYRVVRCPGPFNYAAIVNRGVRHSRADFVVTLNNDTILVTPDWLEQMVG